MFEIKMDKGSGDVLYNGIDLNEGCTGVDIRIRPGERSEVTLFFDDDCVSIKDIGATIKLKSCTEQK